MDSIGARSIDRQHLVSARLPETLSVGNCLSQLYNSFLDPVTDCRRASRGKPVGCPARHFAIWRQFVGRPAGTVILNQSRCVSKCVPECVPWALSGASWWLPPVLRVSLI